MKNKSRLWRHKGFYYFWTELYFGLTYHSIADVMAISWLVANLANQDIDHYMKCQTQYFELVPFL